MSTKMTDFLKMDEGKPAKAAVQGYVEPELRAQVLEQMKADKKAGIKITWDEFLTAACKAYLSEREGA